MSLIFFTFHFFAFPQLFFMFLFFSSLLSHKVCCSSILLFFQCFFSCSVCFSFILSCFLKILMFLFSPLLFFLKLNLRKGTIFSFFFFGSLQLHGFLSVCVKNGETYRSGERKRLPDPVASELGLLSASGVRRPSPMAKKIVEQAQRRRPSGTGVVRCPELRIIS